MYGTMHRQKSTKVSVKVRWGHRQGASWFAVCSRVDNVLSNNFEDRKRPPLSWIVLLWSEHEEQGMVASIIRG